MSEYNSTNEDGQKTTRYIYNHRQDPVDTRDHKFHLKVAQLTTLPPSADLRKTGYLPKCLDQGNLGSCTANATSNALRFCLRKEKALDFQPSRLFIYYFSRLIENTVSEDSGCYIRDVMKEVQTYGACSENNWGYNISQFAVHPPTTAVRAARTHISSFQYMSVNQDLNSIKNALVQGFPIIFGIQVFESLEAEAVFKTGLIPMPNTTKEQCLGGHCVLMVGYDDATRRFTFQNSWGESVGQNGFFTIPYDYVLNPNLASDFWTCTKFV
jgi:C1A family cysteine protease